METNYQLLNIICEVQRIYIDSKEKQPIAKKMENRNKGDILITEAKKLIDVLQNEISKMDSNTINKNRPSEVDRLIELASVPNINFKEVIYIINKLRAYNVATSENPQITDHIENDYFEDVNNI